MNFPQDMDKSTKGLITALAFRFAKNKPGLEHCDLINEALIKYEEMKEWYDPTKSALNTSVYRIIVNHFINLVKPTESIHNHELKETDHFIWNDDNFSEEDFNDALLKIKGFLLQPLAGIILDKLIENVSQKKNTRELCKELNITFFRYQQAEYQIKHAIQKATQ